MGEDGRGWANGWLGKGGYETGLRWEVLKGKGGESLEVKVERANAAQ